MSADQITELRERLVRIESALDMILKDMDESTDVHKSLETRMSRLEKAGFIAVGLLAAALGVPGVENILAML
ncbi:hypothetical protein OG984_06495 [Nocardioides sp. NBC_00368]|uniref:hypothetical protein n=1 Tax=Nocardioides sp. NBC_00368 TaxID=2976000 RepID=UPI002E246A8F